MTLDRGGGVINRPQEGLNISAIFVGIINE
jgi:hypothetical protein